VLRGIALSLLTGVLWFSASPMSGAPVVFTVDSTNSVITESGQIVISGLTIPFAEQGPGSLTTHYSGTLLVYLAPPALQFPGGSMIVALTNGDWQPAAGGAAGSAPADLGGRIDISLGIFGKGTGFSAGRNIKLDLASQTLALTNSNFDASQLNVSYITNSPPVPTFDFRLTGTGLVTSTNGSTPLAGTFTNGTAAALLESTAGLLKLTIPVNVTNISQFMSPDDTTTVLQGQIIATAPASAWSFPLRIDTSGGQATLTWPSLAGQTFIVKASTNLQDWSNASGNTMVNGNFTTWSTSLSNSRQFYRVQLQ